VYGEARVCGSARVYGNAQIFNSSRVSGTTKISENEWTIGNAQGFGGHSQTCGNTWVSRDG